MEKTSITKANADIRATLQVLGVRQWELAAAVGIGEVSMVRKLRHELPDDVKEKYMTAIFNIAKERTAENDT
jgi:hypothetical protein